MKINRALRWKKRLKLLRNSLVTSPFLLAGGIRRFAQGQAGKFEVRHVELPLPQLPAAWDGMTITQISDLHIGPAFTVEDHLPPVINACRELNSDLLVITGDWVDCHSARLPQAIPLLRQLTAPLGVYGCLGNHDIFNNRWNCVKTLRHWLGANLLVNSGVVLERNGSKLALSGIDYSPDPVRRGRHFAAFIAAQPKEPMFRIALAHDPMLFPDLRACGIDLVLSGHTHGGQISLTPAPFPLVGPMMFKLRYVRGLYREGNSTLYVNRGLGQMLPVRLNNPPEITQLRLMRLEDAVLQTTCQRV